MRHIQDFQREKGDTPRIMYARLTRFAKETGDAFIECQLVALYMAKEDKHIRWRILNCYWPTEVGLH